MSITDDFCTGDQFRIYDWGVAIGDTSTPIVSGLCSFNGPVAAFEDPSWSSGTFLLGAGAHSITIETIINPFNVGRAFIKVNSVRFTAKELKERAVEALLALTPKIFELDGVVNPGQANHLLVVLAIDFIESSLTGFLPDDGNRLIADLGSEVFHHEELALDYIKWAIIFGKISNDEILADLDAVIGDLHAADDILAQTALDDATEAGAAPNALDKAAMRLDEARAQADVCEMPAYDPVDDGVKGNQTEPEGPTCDDAIRSYGRSWGWSN